MKFAKSESHSIRKIIIVHLLDKNVRAAETIALENQNHLSVLESTTLSRFFNQVRNANNAGTAYVICEMHNLRALATENKLNQAMFAVPATQTI